MIKKEVLFQFDNCRMTLFLPTAVEKMSIMNLRKILKWSDQERWRNEDSIRTLFNSIPEISEVLKKEWDDACITFQKDYLDEKFDSRGHLITNGEERKKRKENNRKLIDTVKKAKRRYERFQKKVPKLEELKTRYL